MNIYIFRHGESQYKQWIVPIEEADDLTDEGIRVVEDSANHLRRELEKTNQLGRGKKVVIHSSGFGRNLHSSKVAKKVFANRGIKSEIRVDGSIGEVENFDWSLFYPLVVGGQVDYNGDKFRVDCALTNPRGLNSVRYFRGDSTHQLSNQAKSSLPQSYQERVGSFEMYPKVIGRLDSKLYEIESADGEIPVILTHEGLTGKFVEKLAGLDNAFLGRGKYFGVMKESGVLIPFHCQDGSLSLDK